uniref:Extracellular calcium-sensing receptor-like n=1 Tax=Saccoglossus kowalevskii TaxID=10224 RepID=A0ABM0GKR9_SACKO|nr:PREDICTED: extracellular calcium-sensing receptor-like [Saccoglossus kowalevskii]
MLGGLFAFHSRIEIQDSNLESGPIREICAGFDYKGFRRSQAMIYAIDEINRRGDILPNITLGYDIRDTCTSVSKSLEAAIDFVANAVDDDSDAADEKRIIGVVGASNSATSISVASVLGIFNMPMISYSSTSRLLSDRILYKSFFRTVPSDAMQAVAMASVVSHFEWTWVGTIAADDSYGRPGIEQFIREAEKQDVCVAFRKLVSSYPTSEEIEEIVKAIMENPNAKVIVTFIHVAKIKLIFEEIAKQGITDRIWIASEAWADNNEIAAMDPSIIVGTQGILLTLGEIPGFGKYLQELRPFGSTVVNPFLEELWETSFDCLLPQTLQLLDNTTDEKQVCSNVNTITETPSYKPTGLWGTYRTYLAVYAFANALENIRTCTEGGGLLEDGACPDINDLQPWQLLKYISKVTFNGTDGRSIHFSDDGDVSGMYHIVNWQESSDADRVVDFIKIGLYDGGAPSGKELTMNSSNAQWSYGQVNKQVPVSVCSSACYPGSRRGVIPGAPSCCFECLPCMDGEISNTTGSTTCTSCPAGYWSNMNKTKCKAKTLDYMAWGDAGGIAVVTMAVIGDVLTLVVIGLFIKHINTPIVKASNRELSFLLLVFIIICFSSAFFYLGLPNRWQCFLQSPLRGCGFTGCVSILLVKTHRVLTIFEAKLPTSLQRKRYMGTRLQLLVATILVAFQLLVYIITSVVVPPVVQYNNEISKTVTYVECVDVTMSANIILILYTWAIAGVCLGFALRARKLPENFNESKHIMFAMFVYLVVWLTYFPAFLWTFGKHKVIAQCVVMLASAYGMLFCVFFPKCYIILFKPSLNTTEAVRKMTMQHSAKKVSSAVDARKTPSTQSMSNTDALRIHAGGQQQNNNKLSRKNKSSSSVSFSGIEVCKNSKPAETKRQEIYSKPRYENGGIDNPIDVTADEGDEIQHFCESDSDPESKNLPIIFRIGSVALPNVGVHTNLVSSSSIKIPDYQDGDEKYMEGQRESDNIPKITHPASESAAIVSTTTVPDTGIMESRELLQPSEKCLCSMSSVGGRRSVELGDDEVFLTPSTNYEFFKKFRCDCSKCVLKEKTNRSRDTSANTKVERRRDEAANEQSSLTDRFYVTIEAAL